MWDPVLLIAQIVSLQSLHYLTLSLVLPPLLYTFTDSRAVAYTHGGSATVGMVMDWRDMAGRSSLEHSPSLAEQTSEHLKSWWTSGDALEASMPLLGHGDMDAHVDPSITNKPSWANDGALLGGWRVSLEHAPQGRVERRGLDSPTPSLAAMDAPSLSRRDETTPALSPLAEAAIRDPLRGWIISIGWLIASAADILIIYNLIRRPTLVLDFTLTLLLTHTILTTYYASSFPTSIFFWIVMAGCVTLVIVIAEQMCVQREMREGLKSVTTRGRRGTEQDDGGEGTAERRVPSRRQNMTPGQEELFNARLASGKMDADVDDELDVDIDEQIELLERGDATGSKSRSIDPS